MTESTHDDNDTPAASDEGVKRMDADTPGAPDGAAVDEQGAGNAPIDPENTDEYNDPKSGGTPVHPAPTADSQAEDPPA